MLQVITTTVTGHIHGISQDWHVTTVGVSGLRNDCLVRLRRYLSEPRRLASKRFAAAMGCPWALALLNPMERSTRSAGGRSANGSRGISALGLCG